MATTHELFAYVQERFGIALAEKENDLWSLVAEKMDMGTHLREHCFHFLTEGYVAIVRKKPQLHDLFDPVFEKIMLYYLDNHSHQFLYLDSAKKLFKLWTVLGTNDISTKTAIALEKPLCELFSNLLHSNYVLDMVYFSPVLWKKLGPMILQAADNFADDPREHIRFQPIIHRYVPERRDLYPDIQMQDIYTQMCGADFFEQPTLLEMQSILTGLHNNALAWHTALAVCDLKDPTMVGSWMQMLETFASLNLDPKNTESWLFWHLLFDNTKDDASGRNLMVALSEAKPPMSKAFNEGWSIVDAIFEGNARYAQASHMHVCINTKELTLPTMLSKEQMLE